MIENNIDMLIMTMNDRISPRKRDEHLPNKNYSTNSVSRMKKEKTSTFRKLSIMELRIEKRLTSTDPFSILY